MSSHKQHRPEGEGGDAGQLRFNWTDSASVRHSPPSQQARTSAEEPASANASLHPTPTIPPSHAPDSPDSSGTSYGPGHPWHYLRQGDNASPVPFEDIPASDESARAMERDLPKARAKRIIAVRERLESEQRELEAARARYQEIIDRGAEALSRYDREIAYGGNDELARAGTLALLFNQAAWRKGRIACLEREHSRGVTVHR